MISHPKDRITQTQATIVVANTMLATGILTLPRTIIAAVGTADAWISLLLGGLISLFAGYMITKVSLLFPEYTFYQYSQALTGKVIGTTLNVLLVIYYVLVCGYVVRILGEVIHVFVLEKTPIEVVIIVFMSVATYLTVGGINPIARLCELFTLPIVLILFLTLTLSFGHFELDNLRPLLSEGFTPVWEGVKSTAFAFTGFEIMFIVSAFMTEPNKAVKSTITAISTIIVLYISVVVVAIGIFTVEELKTLTWPTMTLAKDIEFPGEFFERFDSFLVIVWIMAIYTTFVPYHYAASLGLGQLFQKNMYYFVFGVLPAIYIIAMYPKDLNAAFKLGEFVGYLAIFFTMIIPIFLWLVAKARRGNHEKN
ncbi:GerAB/ArcD/ProY family transporter [Aneurinibacillus thermoaerophilus]|uniref:GerAB/ArcD/ProY family transporter n=1 Tax=Aneurinibacillus thermoaerophilus TaxID=143495 RepID=UPI002E23CACD|nr:GerAB/ArcD/ProY family transporter [Aneurinibacillus thermoaerophilus]MED0677785.1 GerAB/ArcD/ProY family transporter [Aneurinibacillus thermoaerophilus]MED0737534.1 GerAB/ArcD/ProY family transporter [Aneurinibacillus thermoaerophilus]MED0758105.1 GerAB/ArcD/ProY family transporter [Aneurinibacillus thermoaerophilus]MED0761259.1 GerAB/ArcD/ProY family transporter [Aneurinibacillus thermoaerophilus]MED0762861.1 GerAB/ArcD/ProY family transporter [Aneurinibacillus thermoaerophilus]